MTERISEVPQSEIVEHGRDWREARKNAADETIKELIENELLRNVTPEFIQRMAKMVKGVTFLTHEVGLGYGNLRLWNERPVIKNGHADFGHNGSGLAEALANSDEAEKVLQNLKAVKLSFEDDERFKKLIELYKVDTSD